MKMSGDCFDGDLGRFIEIREHRFDCQILIIKQKDSGLLKAWNPFCI